MVRTCGWVFGLVVFVAAAPAWAEGLRPGKPADHNVSEEDLAKLRAVLQKAVKDGELRGCSLLVAHKGEVIFKEAFGNLRVTAAVRIASDTKPLTTSTVLALVDQGKVDLDAPLAKYLPEFKGTKVEKAKVRQVMSHTAGILPSLLPGRPPEMTLAEAVQTKVARGGKLTDPGTFRYGGTSMDVAARVAEASGGRPFEELQKKYILDPLGMKTTRFASAASAGVVSKEAAARGEGRYVACGGGMTSTLDDMAALYQMHLDGGTFGGKRVLSAKAVAAMHEPQKGAVNARQARAGAGLGRDYGLGLYLARKDRAGTPQTVHHGGALGTMGWLDKDRQVVGVFFSQGGLRRATPVIVRVQGQVRAMLPAGK